MMRYVFCFLLFAILLFPLFFSSSAFATGVAAGQDEMPRLELTIPDIPEHQDYLGVQGSPGDSFTVEDIDADILLIELFSMYCPFCQEEAPYVNELYEMMQALPADGPRVKIIGLGAGNSAFEVDHFRSTYDVEFPLFPDKDLSMYKALSGAGTPGFIGVKKTAEDGFVIVLRQSGGFHDKESFLEQLLTSGAKE
ncbi:MAG: redoxin domain-containing protein [Desulfocapsaceae bacterium]|jgi:thiol-disulfide isomerase/thioredoxin|nr:redoxin domain-containing protein [Desulfocapsaceae bacterium]